MDASSCTHGLADPGEVLTNANRDRHSRIELLDSVAWGERLLPHLRVASRRASVAVHPTCSTRHLGQARRLERLVGELADDVYVPPSATCCGFAGDRGMLHPELTAAATRDQASELAEREFDAYVSSNRTCEVGLERATGAPYESFVFLLEELTRG
jgi:D-lactate dehydrogenase